MKLETISLVRLGKENKWVKDLVNIMLFLIILINLKFFLSITSSSISIASFATVIGAPVGIASATFSLSFWKSTGIVKKLLKTTRNEKKKHNKIVVLARRKMNSIESKISDALINGEISHEDFTTIINEEKNCCELKDSINKMKIQRSDTAKNFFIEEGKKKPLMKLLDKMLKCKTMLFYCLKCKKI